MFSQMVSYDFPLTDPCTNTFCTSSPPPRNPEGVANLKKAGVTSLENIRFSSLFAAGEVSRGTSPAAKSEEKRMFSQAKESLYNFFIVRL